MLVFLYFVRVFAIFLNSALALPVVLFLLQANNLCAFWLIAHTIFQKVFDIFANRWQKWASYCNLFVNFKL